MLTDKDKLKSYFVKIYPELDRLPNFQNLAHLQYIQMTEKYRIFLRIGIPTFVFFFVLIIGTWLGTFINSLGSSDQIKLDSLPGVAPITQESYSSPYKEIKQQMIEFNPSLPDPLYPVLDYQISLEPIITPKP
jgi:hypothetical protein